MAATTRCYTAREFAVGMGTTLEDWRIGSRDIVCVDPNDRIYARGMYYGHVTPEEREYLDRKPTALDRINEGRARIGLPPLDPIAARWTAEDIEIEASRIAPNPARSPWVAPTAALVGRVFGGMAFTGAGRALFGTNEPMGNLFPPVLISRIVGQVLGATAMAALAAPDQRVRAALGAAAGAWVPYVGGPLAAAGVYYATRRRANPSSPSLRRWMWIGGAAVVALLLGGSYAYARVQKSLTPDEPLSPDAAVARAIQILGTDASAVEVADAAYPMAYPECPGKLDPQDPTHAQCIELWNQLHALAKATLPKPTWGPRPVPDDLPEEGPAADMRRWLDSLTPHQRTELRKIIGPEYYDPIKRAAQAGDDGKTVGNVVRLKNAIEEYASKDKMAALKQYYELKQLLGPKLDELLGMAKKYQDE